MASFDFIRKVQNRARRSAGTTAVQIWYQNSTTTSRLRHPLIQEKRREKTQTRKAIRVEKLHGARLSHVFITSGASALKIGLVSFTLRYRIV